MKTIKILVLLIAVNVFFNYSYAQSKKDKGTFPERKTGFYDEILNESNNYITTTTPEKKSYKVDFTGMDIPKDTSEFKYYWFNAPVSQGLTGTCWSFSTTSYYESEIYRIHNKKIKLSEMYTVYWEYVEKAKFFVKTRGKSHFGEGSEGNAVARIWKAHGIVPLEAYSGLLPGQKFHDHRKMFEEMNNYLQSLKTLNAWDEEAAMNTIKAILNNYMGTPPSTFTYEGEEYSANDYLEKVVDLKLDDYVDVVSFMQYPYYTNVLYDVEDNWWYSTDYYNVPLDEYMTLITKAIQNGYTVCIGGDVSEAGYDSWSKAAIVPTFDIPSEYIDENARQFRFLNGTSGDDHGIHLVGYMNKNGKNWFLIKDSGAGSKNVEPKGFVYYHEDYVKLKMLSMMVHKDAMK
jgi:bleomycin hydrolase